MPDHGRVQHVSHPSPGSRPPQVPVEMEREEQAEPWATLGSASSLSSRQRGGSVLEERMAFMLA